MCCIDLSEKKATVIPFTDYQSLSGCLRDTFANYSYCILKAIIGQIKSSVDCDEAFTCALRDIHWDFPLYESNHIFASLLTTSWGH